MRFGFFSLTMVFNLDTRGHRTPENPLRGRSKKKKSLSGLFLGPSYPDYRDYPDFLKILEKQEFIHIFYKSCMTGDLSAF